MKGYIKAVCISRERGTIKQNVQEAVLIRSMGWKATRMPAPGTGRSAC